MRVSLSPVRKPYLPADQRIVRAGSVASSDGARVMLGQKPAADGLADPIRPAADSLFGPRGATLAGPQGPLFVCDTGHHRLLIWNYRATARQNACRSCSSASQILIPKAATASQTSAPQR